MSLTMSSAVKEINSLKDIENIGFEGSKTNGTLMGAKEETLV